jgi:hypothetical protein
LLSSNHGARNNLPMSVGVTCLDKCVRGWYVSTTSVVRDDILNRANPIQLPMCLHHGLAVPPALVQATYNFHMSALWSNRSSHPGSLTEIAFRLVNLHAAIKSGYITQPRVRSVALEIDHDLEVWRQGVPPGWRYTIIQNKGNRNTRTYLDGKSHIYANHRIAEAWNSWRIQRISINQIIQRNELSSGPGVVSVTAISAIRQFSEDICSSIEYLMDSPRMSCLRGSTLLILGVCWLMNP